MQPIALLPSHKFHAIISIMIAYNDLKKGTLFMWNGEPYEVLEYNFVRMQQRRPSAQTKIKNLKTGAISLQTFKQSDTFEELEFEKRAAVFVFCNRGTCTFHVDGKPNERFMLLEHEKLEGKAQYLKPNTEVTARYIDEELLDIQIPIKVDLKVTEAPPAVRGNTAQGGSKTATLETGSQIQVPLFVNTGDIIRVNTDTGLYAERMEKSKE